MSRPGIVPVMRLGQQIRFDGVEWWTTLDAPDLKTGRPHRVPLPASLTQCFECYVEGERREFLDDQASDAMWINWGGKTLGEAGIEKPIHYRSARRFGPEDALGGIIFGTASAPRAPHGTRCAQDRRRDARHQRSNP
ncbi:MAG: hypothetical protein EON48_01685 [Acetobacteraceae bacterium]|nr:MAG: hypothetical protein EON48_01685 [Acetobacteraceae bacterium]